MAATTTKEIILSSAEKLAVETRVRNHLCILCKVCGEHSKLYSIWRYGQTIALCWRCAVAHEIETKIIDKQTHAAAVRGRPLCAWGPCDFFP